MARPRSLRGASRPRLTGLSVLVAGASWDWTPSERDAIRDLIVFLEDRRALSAPNEREYSDHVIQSVLDIRRELTQTLQRLPERAKSGLLVDDMRARCRAFLDATQAEPWAFNEKLGELRAGIGVSLGILSDTFGLDVRPPLSDILPPHAQRSE